MSARKPLTQEFARDDLVCAASWHQCSPHSCIATPQNSVLLFTDEFICGSTYLQSIVLHFGVSSSLQQVKLNVSPPHCSVREFALKPCGETCHFFTMCPSCCAVLTFSCSIESSYHALPNLSSQPLQSGINHRYRCFVFGEHGTLGRRVRIRIPECVIEFIRSICPDPNNNYTGHRDIDEDGTELQVGYSRNNESFESVLPDSILGKVDFEGGEKVKICVSFDDNMHPIQKVREFVNKSPAQGWTVTFSGENYTNATMICNSAGA